MESRALPMVPVICLMMLCAGLPALAETSGRGSVGSLFAARGQIVPAVHGGVVPGATRGTASLFAGREGASLFALATREAGLPSARGLGQAQFVLALPGGAGADVAHLLRIIGQAEARRNGYDAVQHGAKLKPPRRPTTLTVSEIYKWIDETPGQQHAIGRYQFIPMTLKRLVREMGVDPRTVFSPSLQDRLADRLLQEAGLNRFRAGQITRHQFMNNLAKIWAGLPTTSGKSHYHGYAGNRATMSWAQFDAEMARIFPG